jgi:XTP/dITP diphosphohydrolase
MPYGQSSAFALAQQTMNRLLLATNNQGKLRELRALLAVADVEIQLITPAEAGIRLHVEEDGDTYVENASKKAMAFSQASGMVTLADDSGLEVDALGGEPGLRSARYLPKQGATDADRRAYLLRKLADKPRPWLARFRAAVAIASPGRPVRHSEGECWGEIIPDERGDGGFGYDRIFLVQGTGMTMAQLPMDQKNGISHRARAVMSASRILRDTFPS